MPCLVPLTRYQHQKGLVSKSDCGTLKIQGLGHGFYLQPLMSLLNKISFSRVSETREQIFQSSGIHMGGHAEGSELMTISLPQSWAARGLLSLPTANLAPLTLPHTHSHTHTHTCSYTHTRTHTCSHTHTHLHMLTHSHTHMLTFSHSHTYTWLYPQSQQCVRIQRSTRQLPPQQTSNPHS